MNATRMLSTLWLSGALLAANGVQALPLFKVTDLGSGRARSINEAGQITGELGGSLAFLYTPGVGFTNIAPLPGFDTGSGLGINNAGQVVGRSWNPSVFRAFRYDDVNGVRDLGPNTFFSEASGINNHGVITGGARFATVDTHAFVFTPSTGLIDLGTLGGSNSQGYAINDAGQVTGTSYTGTPQPAAHAFLYTPGVGMVDLGALHGYHSAGYALNDAQQVTGTFTAVDPTEIPSEEGPDGVQVNAFLYSPTTGMVDIGTLADGDARGYGIDRHGNVVGSVLFKAAGPRPYPDDASAFYYSAQTGMVDLNNLLVAADKSEWVLTGAYDINDRGQIVGYGWRASDFEAEGYHALLLTPIPEPSALALMLAGTAVLGLALRKRRR